MTDPCRPWHVAILIYPHAQMSAVLGLTDLFAVADRLARNRAGGMPPRLRVSHVGPIAETGRMAVSFDTAARERAEEADERPDVVILPPSLGDPPSGEAVPALAGWLRQRHAAGATLASVCAGGFLLAETGLLDGRPATTHWTCSESFAARFPRVRVDTEKLLIDDGDIVTAGGLMAWTDLGLHLLGRYLNRAAMVETARFLVIDPPGREQRYYTAFSPRRDHGDAAVLKVQRWLDIQDERAFSVGAMAMQAGLEERTFLRRFSAATGLRPVEYCQHLRIDRARELLESTNATVERIGWDVGYGDPASFRKLFLKLTGLTPSSYRRRFGARSQADASAP